MLAPKPGRPSPASRRDLIEQVYTEWTNPRGTGWNQHDNQPFIIAGSGAGYLKAGEYIDVGGVSPYSHAQP